MDPEIKSFVIEQWAEYGAIALILCSRLAVRIGVQGFRRLDGDDYLSVLAFVIITVMSFAAQGVAVNGHNRWVHRAPTPWVAFFTRSKKRVQSNRADRVPPNEAARLQIVTETPEVAESLAVGSKWFLVGWFTYPGFVWTEKLCILFLLKRLTRGLWVERLVKPMMAIVITCYLIIVVIVTTYRIPFHKIWQIYPDPGTRCHPDTPGLYMAVLVMNCLTDLGIAAIPIPVSDFPMTDFFASLLRHARMHWAKKVGIAVILCASVFTMIAAVMRVYFSMTGKVGAAHAFWACRECLVSCFVVNAPIFVAVFRSSFWRPNGNSYGSYFGSSGKGRRAGVGGDGAGGYGQVPAGHTELEDRKHGRNKYRHPHEMDTWLAHDRTIVDYEATSSTERIHQPQEGGHSSVDEHQKIHVKRDIQIRHLSSDGDESQLREDRMP
ncbi:hypothetical protein PG996_003139 [Apiospora saccharicola]|uniref:Rhodopsin domain-containing protein n=1 Tax=Apiospora saccharicola TaxID=335842 RepID=A0ABR1W475_9PEZI